MAISSADTRPQYGFCDEIGACYFFGESGVGPWSGRSVQLSWCEGKPLQAQLEYTLFPQWLDELFQDDKITGKIEKVNQLHVSPKAAVLLFAHNFITKDCTFYRWRKSQTDCIIPAIDVDGFTVNIVVKKDLDGITMMTADSSGNVIGALPVSELI